MRIAVLAAAFLVTAGEAAAQPLRIEDRPLVTAQGAGEVTRTPDWVRIGFSVRGEGATPVDALASLARQRDVVVASLRALKGIGALEISDSALSTQEVRSPACSPQQPYLAQQRLSTGDCAVVGAITTIEVDVKVRPATRAGDVASLAAQLGGKSVGLRGSGFDHESDVQAEAAQRAVAEARRQAELIARAAGGRLGELLRVQDGAAVGYPLVVSGSAVAPPPMGLPAPPAPPPPPVAQSVTLGFTPQPLTRISRVTLIFALAQP